MFYCRAVLALAHRASHDVFHMNDETPRKNSLRLKGFDYSTRQTYFVTIVCNDRKNHFSNEDFTRESMEILLNQRLELQFNLYSYVFMLNHFHALLGPGPSDLSL